MYHFLKNIFVLLILYAVAIAAGLGDVWLWHLVRS